MHRTCTQSRNGVSLWRTHKRRPRRAAGARQRRSRRDAARNSGRSSPAVRATALPRMTRVWQVGITDRVAAPFDLEAQGFGGPVAFRALDWQPDGQITPNMVAGLDAILWWSPVLDEKVADLLAESGCRIVVRYGVGHDKVDLAALARHGIAFANNPDYGCEEVADSAVAMLLGFLRRLFEHDSLARTHAATWQDNILWGTRRLRGAKIGIIGVGRIGQCVVHRLRPFGVTVYGYDPFQPSGHEKAVGYHRVRDLADLVAEVDAVTLHCPLTDATAGMVDDAFVERLRPGTILVNTARGRLIASLDVLERGLRRGRLAGVGLDVLPEEPPRPHPLLDAWRRREPWLDGRFVVMPHNAFYSDAAWSELRVKAAETAWLYLERGTLRNSVP